MFKNKEKRTIWLFEKCLFDLQSPIIYFCKHSSTKTKTSCFSHENYANLLLFYALCDRRLKYVYELHRKTHNTFNSIYKVKFTFLGFLYLSRENKGDYALQDIYTALHWLKNYVTNFNGDPDRITLYGTGSGAVLASLVVMLETVNGL